MSDLISRSALLEIFNHDLKCFETNGKTEAEMYISVADMRKMIEEQPTAYDVDKVLHELREATKCNIDCYENGETEVSEYNDSWNDDIISASEAIEIVRKGGVNE